MSSSTDEREQIADEQPEWNVHFNPVPKSLEKDFFDLFTGYDEGLCKGEPGGFIMPGQYAQNAEKIFRFRPRSDDVWVVTYPKCGTTWTQELVWLVMNDCNTQLAQQIPLNARSPFLELPYFLSFNVLPQSLKQVMMPLEAIDHLPSPRIIKSHLTFDLLHPKLLDTCKVVYVARNPKDVIVSFYFHHKLIIGHGYQGDLEQFAEFFMNDEIMCCPFFDHLIKAWNLRHHPNMHYMFYEDMKKDLRGEIEKVATFLGKSLTGEQLDLLTDHLRFTNIEKNPSVNSEKGKEMGFMNKEGKFIRKGQTGDWKNHFSPELNRRIDEWVDRNLAHTDLTFVTELENQIN